MAFLISTCRSTSRDSSKHKANDLFKKPVHTQSSVVNGQLEHLIKQALSNSKPALESPIATSI